MASLSDNYGKTPSVSPRRFQNLPFCFMLPANITAFTPCRRHAELIGLFNSRWEAEYGGREPQPRPVESWFDRANSKVARIATKRKIGAMHQASGLQYFVHWQGAGGSSWETAEALHADPDNAAAVKHFEQSIAVNHAPAPAAGAAAAPPAPAPAAPTAQRIATEDEEDEDASDYEDADGLPLEGEEDFPRRKTTGESDVLLPLPMGKSLPSGGVISDDNLLKLALGHSLSAAGVTLSDVAELAGCPSTMLHSWMFGRGRIDDHSEAELKKWLKKHATPAWRQRLPDVHDTVANAKDKHTRKRLALRKSLGTNFSNVSTKGGGVSTETMVGPDAPDADLWLKWQQAGGSTYKPDPAVFDLSPADGGASGVGHLEQYALVDHATLQALMEGVAQLPQAQQPCPPLSSPEADDAEEDAAAEEGGEADEEGGGADEEGGEASADAAAGPAQGSADAEDGDVDLTRSAVEEAGPAPPAQDSTPPPPAEYAFNHYQRQLLALAAVDEGTAAAHTARPGAPLPASLPAPAGVDLAGVPAHAVQLAPEGNPPPVNGAAIVQLLASSEVPTFVTSAGVRVGGHWMPRNLSQAEFEHLAIKAIAAAKNQAPEAVPGVVVQQLWAAYVACDWSTRDAAVWLGTAPIASAGALRTAPTAYALPKALSSAPPADVSPPPAGSAPPPSQSGMPPLNSDVYAQARERTAADLKRREAEERAAVDAAKARKAAEQAIAAKSAAAAAANTVTYHGQSSAQSQAEQSHAAAAEALRLLGTEAVSGLRHRGLQPMVFPSRPDQVALYGFSGNGTLALQGNVQLAEAKTLGLQTLQQVQAQAQQQGHHMQPHSHAHSHMAQGSHSSTTSAAHGQHYSHGGAAMQMGGMMNQ